MTSVCNPLTLASITADSPLFQIDSSTSFLDFSAISSILAGWILPSATSLSTVNLAISLLTGSKQERVTASGVSSIIRSTPVAASIALIFLPSLPIRRPFMSSLGKGTLETVASDTTSEAKRCIA